MTSRDDKLRLRVTVDQRVAMAHVIDEMSGGWDMWRTHRDREAGRALVDEIVSVTGAPARWVVFQLDMAAAENALGLDVSEYETVEWEK